MQRDIQECSMCFYETWLGERMPDEAIKLHGDTVFKGDRSMTTSGKTHSGGTAVLVKQTWCTDCGIIFKSCSENVEYLEYLQLFYLPRHDHVQ